MNKKKLTIKSSLIDTKPNRRNKTKAPPMWSRKKPMARWLLTRLGSKKGVGITLFGCPRMSLPIWRGLKWCGFQRRLEAKNGIEGFGGLAHKMMRRFKPKKLNSQLGHFGAQVPHKVMVARFQFMHHVDPLLLLRCLHALYFLVLLMVGCLWLDLTHEQPTWFDKCVESYTRLPLHSTWTSWGMYFIFVPWTQAIE